VEPCSVNRIGARGGEKIHWKKQEIGGGRRILQQKFTVELSSRGGGG